MAIVSLLIISFPPLLRSNCRHGDAHGRLDHMPEALETDRQKMQLTIEKFLIPRLKGRDPEISAPSSGG